MSSLHEYWAMVRQATEWLLSSVSSLFRRAFPGLSGLEQRAFSDGAAGENVYWQRQVFGAG